MKSMNFAVVSAEIPSRVAHFALLSTSPGRYCLELVVISFRHRIRDTFSIYTLGAKGDSTSRSLFEATAYA